MLNRWAILIGILFVLFLASTVLGQNVEVLKAELKGTEGRLDAKIDGAKNELNTKIEGTEKALNNKIDGAKNELNTKIEGTEKALSKEINGVNNRVEIILWIIGGIGAAITIFLSFFAYLLNYLVKKLLPDILQHESRSTRKTQAGHPQREPTSGEGFADNAQSDYLLVEGESQ